MVDTFTIRLQVEDGKGKEQFSLIVNCTVNKNHVNQKAMIKGKVESGVEAKEMLESIIGILGDTATKIKDNDKPTATEYRAGG